jgi:hypothetical protein
VLNFLTLNGHAEESECNHSDLALAS